LAVSLFRKTEGDHDMEGPQHPSTQKAWTGSECQPAEAEVLPKEDPSAEASAKAEAIPRRRARSSLVRRLVQAKDDPAKQRIRRWLGDIDDARLLRFGLTPEDIALLRGSRGSGNFVYLLLMCALSVPSPPGSWF
jgi:hypothetical protein